MEQNLQEGTVKGGYGGAYSLTITFVNPEKWKTFMAMTPDFMEKYAILFKNCVFESHRYLIRVTPIQTGRLRAGWTGILNKYNQDYTRAFADTALLDFIAIDGKPLSQEAIMEGMAMSQFIDSEFNVSLINNVPYSEFVEYGTSKMEGRYFTKQASYKAEYIFEHSMEEWIRQMSIAGEVTNPPEVEEVSA